MLGFFFRTLVFCMFFNIIIKYISTDTDLKLLLRNVETNYIIYKHLFNPLLNPFSPIIVAPHHPVSLLLKSLLCLWPSHHFSGYTYSSNIWVGQTWWIKTMCVCTRMIYYTAVYVWYVFDILKQCVWCIHLRQPFGGCYKSPSAAQSHPGNLTGDVTAQHQGCVCVCVFPRLCVWGMPPATLLISSQE